MTTSTVPAESPAITAFCSAVDRKRESNSTFAGKGAKRSVKVDQCCWASTVVGSLLLACVFPFASFAALAALTMTPRRGLMLVTAAWALNQATGFFIMSFPWEAQAVGHGIAILAATLAATVVARFALDKVNGPVALRAGAALLSAFVVHQVLLRAYASVGGGAENFSAEIISGVALNDAIWFAGLLNDEFE